MSSINGQNIERMRVNGNEIALAKINRKVVFQKKKLIKTFFGDSKQDTTSGKNIFNVNDGSIYWDGCLISIKNNILKIKMESIGNGGITQQVITDYTDFNFDINENYYFSLTLKSGSYQKKSTTDTTYIRPYIRYEDGSSSYLSISLNENNFLSTKIKFTNNKKPISYAFGVYSPNGTIANDSEVEYFVQIEKGSTATEYEPYTGGKPSPNPDYPQKISSINGVNLKLVGKNLFDKNTQNFINGFLSDTRNTIVDSNNVKTFFIPCNPNSIYTISKQKGNYFRVATTIYEPSLGISLSQIIVNNNSSSITINTNNDSKYLLFNVYDKTQDFVSESDMLNSIQLEKGSQVTTYEPYKTQNIPINLQNNILAKVGDYADELQVYLNGDVKIVKKIGKTILNNTANYDKSTYSTDEYFKGYLNGEETLNFAEYKKVMNTHFQSGEYNQTSQGEMLANRRQLHIQILASRLSENSVTGLQEWLGNNNVIVLRPLENQIIRKIQNIKEELNQFGDYSNIEIETTYS